MQKKNNNFENYVCTTFILISFLLLGGTFVFYYYCDACGIKPHTLLSNDNNLRFNWLKSVKYCPQHDIFIISIFNDNGYSMFYDNANNPHQHCQGKEYNYDLLKEFNVYVLCSDDGGKSYVPTDNNTRNTIINIPFGEMKKNIIVNHDENKTYKGKLCVMNVLSYITEKDILFGCSYMASRVIETFRNIDLREYS